MANNQPDLNTVVADAEKYLSLNVALADGRALMHIRRLCSGVRVLLDAPCSPDTLSPGRDATLERR